ncbi:hypothetical protein BDP55DRAFT_730840 [Colletotrichum godetiae]|uniref:Uncharacterized protein n=1 Tax=Colletotrichum godetiae TaxID=1209918 RepID=A0AAJ0AFS2_9PEZI|nr:uncharacterized protein BDP55DRAFT_730840 [Colletotrichum godetiae]KAK1673099.1 hypothetical protein BDP55DRAFT_730840 [Colletotrichum godetiae]
MTTIRYSEEVAKQAMRKEIVHTPALVDLHDEILRTVTTTRQTKGLLLGANTYHSTTKSILRNKGQEDIVDINRYHTAEIYIRTDNWAAKPLADWFNMVHEARLEKQFRNKYWAANQRANKESIPYLFRRIIATCFSHEFADLRRAKIAQSDFSQYSKWLQMHGRCHTITFDELIERQIVMSRDGGVQPPANNTSQIEDIAPSASTDTTALATVAFIAKGALNPVGATMASPDSNTTRSMTPADVKDMVNEMMKSHNVVTEATVEGLIDRKLAPVLEAVAEAKGDLKKRPTPSRTWKRMAATEKALMTIANALSARKTDVQEVIKEFKGDIKAVNYKQEVLE